MRLLANENVPLVAVEALRQAGHDTAWVLTDGPGSSDESVLARAAQEGRVLLTFDKDFAALVFRRGADATRGVVLLRVPMMLPDELGRFVVAALGSRSDWEGHFTVVEPGRLRMRDLPPRPKR